MEKESGKKIQSHGHKPILVKILLYKPSASFSINVSFTR